MDRPREGRKAAVGTCYHTLAPDNLGVAHKTLGDELRNGPPAAQARAPVSPDVVRALSIPLFFDYLGVRLNGPKAAGKRSIINWDLPDLGEIYVLNLENCARSYLAGKHAPDADATITLDRQVLNRIAMWQTTLADAIDQGFVKVIGNASKLHEVFDLLDDFQLMFPVIEPHTA